MKKRLNSFAAYQNVLPPVFWPSIAVSVGILILFGSSFALAGISDITQTIAGILLASGVTVILMWYIHWRQSHHFNRSFAELCQFVEQLRQTPSHQWLELRVEKKLPTRFATLAASLNALAVEHSTSLPADHAKTCQEDKNQRESFDYNGSELPTHKRDSSTSVAIKKALIVDDNAANRKLVSQFLVEAGIEVDQANNGKQALSYFSQHNYCMVLMDLEMPGLDGIETTQRMRKDEKSSRTFIFGLTAHTFADNPTYLLKANMDDYLSKPLTAESLNLLLKKWSFESQLPFSESDQHYQSVSASDQGENKDQAPVDVEQCLQLARGNYELAKDMLSMLLNSLPQELNTLKKALETENRTTLQDTVHRIHGGACYCGVPNLLKSSATLDQLLQKELGIPSNRHIDPLVRDINTLIEWRKKNNLDNIFTLSRV